jgi:hypothetical protein
MARTRARLSIVRMKGAFYLPSAKCCFTYVNLRFIVGLPPLATLKNFGPCNRPLSLGCNFVVRFIRLS